jgi:hypothetical protein
VTRVKRRTRRAVSGGSRIRAGKEEEEEDEEEESEAGRLDSVRRWSLAAASSRPRARRFQTVESAS